MARATRLEPARWASRPLAWQLGENLARLVSPLL
jgi:hypothetical protein